MDLFPKWNTESLAARKCLDMGMGASVIARTLSTPCWKMTGLFRRNCSFLENLFLSALICTILTEKCCSSYLADAGDLYMFNLCQISSEHRFGYEMTSFSFLFYQPQVATRSGVSAVFLPLFYGCLNVFSHCTGSISPGSCAKVLPTHDCSRTASSPT